MAIEIIPGVGPTNTDVANAVAAAVPSAANIQNIVTTYGNTFNGPSAATIAAAVAPGAIISSGVAPASLTLRHTITSTTNSVGYNSNTLGAVFVIIAGAGGSGGHAGSGFKSWNGGGGGAGPMWSGWVTPTNRIIIGAGGTSGGDGGNTQFGGIFINGAKGAGSITQSQSNVSGQTFPYRGGASAYTTGGFSVSGNCTFSSNNASQYGMPGPAAMFYPSDSGSSNGPADTNNANNTASSGGGGQGTGTETNSATFNTQLYGASGGDSLIGPGAGGGGVWLKRNTTTGNNNNVGSGKGGASTIWGYNGGARVNHTNIGSGAVGGGGGAGILGNGSSGNNSSDNTSGGTVSASGGAGGTGGGGGGGGAGCASGDNSSGSGGAGGVAAVLIYY